MDRNTIIAIVLSVIVISVGLTIQTTFFSAPPEAPVQETVTDVSAVAAQTGEVAPTETVFSAYSRLVAVGSEPSRSRFTFETDVFIIEFDPKGAGISSLRLKKHLDNKEPVELLFSTTEKELAFLMYVGDDFDQPIEDTFSYRIEGNSVIFSRDFVVIEPNGKRSEHPITIEKRYNFGASDYLFEIAINLKNSQNLSIPLNLNGYAYSLAFEPQLGPEFHQTPDGNYTYRRFYIEKGGKKETIKIKNGVYTTSDYITWAALTSKYFSIIAVPDASRYKVSLFEEKGGEIPLESHIYFSRPVVKAADSNDVFRFYVGPQLKDHMKIYNDESQNSFGLRDLHLENALDSSSWLGWLENILKWLLRFFYRLVPNWGVAIILLTILIKIILQPFTKKGMESTARMQALNPQMEEIRARYKDNPNKMNQEIGELYKREKISPLGGCLPMLLQFPIFIALYGLLNKHFELRGAMFIPGWIVDLSMPESIFHFNSFSLPFIGSDIRLLPILYGASMILSFRINQAGGTQQAGMTGKFMTYGMPIMFFFILYNAPSGLLLYWMVQNLISIGQQFYINKKGTRKGDKPAAEPTLQKQPKKRK